jgi:hypothetical protein
MACHACRDDRLARLRLLMQEATDLAEPIDYYFDYLADDEELVRRSKLGAPGFDETLHAVAQRLCGPGTLVIYPVFTRYRDLWHGACRIGGWHATVLYQRRIDVGIVAVRMPGTFAYARFQTLAAVPPDVKARWARAEAAA